MLGRIPSRIVIILCLLVALCLLFLRSIVYYSFPMLNSADEDTAQTQAKRPITLAYHDRPPYYQTGPNNSLTGIVGENARLAFHYSELPFTIQHMPANRQMSMVQDNSDRICAVGWFKTSAREHYARFTLPIYQDRPTAIITRADISISSPHPTIEDVLRMDNLSLLKKNGYSYGEYVEQALQKATTKSITTTGDTQQMLEMVASGKADYFFISPEEAETMLANIDSAERFQLLTLHDVPPGNIRYIMCSKQVTSEEIDRLNQAIAAISIRGGATVQRQ